MNQALACGKLALISINSLYSLVMEYADNGDVFQKICSYQKRETYIKEKKYGTSSYKSLGGSKLFMIERFFTEIWR